MKLLWGDLHNHCGITYGFGALEHALEAAKSQLDFCAIIGHAMWPDMPGRTDATAFLVDFHNEGFAKLREDWENVRSKVKEANIAHEFVTFQGYEIHSSAFGDHHILSPSDELPLEYAASPQDLADQLAAYDAIAVPHHIGYTPGYRGIDWEAFRSDISPIVEVFSKHGCGMSDSSSYPYYHTMGPKDSRNTVLTGLKKGKKFSFAGSTDHHAGYPGSYGDGRVAVWAKEKTRESIWEAIKAGRTYAVTGDKIACRFSVNGAEMGSSLETSEPRQLVLDAECCDYIDKITIYKNAKPWKALAGESLVRKESQGGIGTYKVRIELGWGSEREGYSWKAKARVSGGKLLSVDSCFRGQSVLAPEPGMRDNPDMNKLGNEIVAQSEEGLAWTCTTFQNPSTLHPATAAVVLEIEGDEATRLAVQANGMEKEVSVGELLEGSRSMHIHSYNSEALLIHRAVPKSAYQVHLEWSDTEKELETDVYYAEIRQANNQFAWISPVFVS
ncbi:DUF3604 domain-containing protein [Paenibacillus sp. J5C_2022]|uniref:DUF3604 domain-containing protein n=1 Tax=Paenibacillus sp. J5C2022 TaxID=2977129 RepID=UPI0021D1F2B6|nr:DUF3604 domain-containing protein [Paenibacillus sp. J5C2022]MCU6709094.1 DUF3604 domain-containing protein [Paenibacillus sp. J5C2022]